MAIEMLNYADLAARLKISPEAARSLAKRLRLPRSRGMTARRWSASILPRSTTPLCRPGHRPVTRWSPPESQDRNVAGRDRKAGGNGGWSPGGLRVGARPKAQAAEFLKMIAITMTAKEVTARLEGELAALKARPWWRRLAG
jgi:hypothetical protein